MELWGVHSSIVISVISGLQGMILEAVHVSTTLNRILDIKWPYFQEPCADQKGRPPNVSVIGSGNIARVYVGLVAQDEL